MTIKRIYLKPKTPELRICYPHGSRYLPLNGAWVPESSYWVRRRMDGDAIQVDPPAAKKIKLTKKAAPQPREE